MLRQPRFLFRCFRTVNAYYKSPILRKLDNNSRFLPPELAETTNSRKITERLTVTATAGSKQRCRTLVWVIGRNSTVEASNPGKGSGSLEKSQNITIRGYPAGVNRLLLRQDKEFGLDVVDLAKDPLAAGPLARSTTRNLNLDEALEALDVTVMMAVSNISK
jgi:hypothetical protein